MFVCYLDDSDAENSAVITLAGYVSQIRIWEQFEEHAAKVYERFGVGILHAKDFEDRKGEFKGWDRDKSKAFLDALLEGALPRLYAVSYSTHKQLYEQRRKEFRGWESIGAYAASFGFIIGHLTYGPLGDLIKRQGLSFVVESGHKNNPGIAQYFHSLKKSRPALQLRSFTESGKEQSRAIQLADLFAFYTRRWAANVEANEKFDDQEFMNASGDPFLKLLQRKTGHVMWITKDAFGKELRVDEAGNIIDPLDGPAPEHRLPRR